MLNDLDQLHGRCQKPLSNLIAINNELLNQAHCREPLRRLTEKSVRNCSLGTQVFPVSPLNNKILKSDWLSTPLIAALTRQYTPSRARLNSFSFSTERIGPHSVLLPLQINEGSYKRPKIPEESLAFLTKPPRRQFSRRAKSGE